mmetsp:Transcript_7982/g.17782  ORF Transcript_7982/g.17782 Transcript_7982/m.17782 type:complete len:543 (-) Transcript_7982:9-1637(-)
MEVTHFNDVKVYNLSSGKSLPAWLQEAQKKRISLKYNDDFRKRIELLQDFEFSVASSRVKVARDGQHIIATGIYPPEMRIFDTRELGMKHNRRMDAEIVDFHILSDDWKKVVFLQDDRNLEFHAQGGRHHRLRVPKPGRSLCYDDESCTLFVAGSSSDMFRLDLEAGTFLAPVRMQELSEVHAVAANPILPIISCAGDNGLVESYDLRDPSRPFQSLKVTRPGIDVGMSDASDGAAMSIGVTACAYSSNGMNFAAGTESGLVRVYDVRSSRPLAERDHMNGLAIKSVCFHSTTAVDELLVGSADAKSVRIWGASNGAVKAAVLHKSPINGMTFCPNSGLFFLANDEPRIGAYFVPSIGLAPKWCSFLDAMTEQLEESDEKTVFDNYEFVTNDQLQQLGATELVGSKFLQPYMHGYFMHQRLHQRLKAATEPFAYEEYRKKRLQQKVEAKRTMRTKLKSKVEVNKSLHEKLKSAADEGGDEGASAKRKAAGEKAKTLLTDSRFKDLFANPDFAMEENVKTADVGPSAATMAHASKKPRKGSRK